ncbi:hypothetical protein [Methanogenium sp. MK-MG]|uniref:hypothetical protein n=1 Tax=Methanogenium sp. MK-MG TaxID=2599926 RepID=UPI0013ECB957|nr:hypothetical protein [Methanogenium sp. MK-MG]KAF1078106.1 hypothetical protein MKMG_00971 [Methanogenium sp. MK-MG]
MDYIGIISGNGEVLDIYQMIIPCLENIEILPQSIEPIYYKAIKLEGDGLDHFRFGLVRLQVYADIHRYEDSDEMQKIKYAAQILEKIIFGNLMLETEAFASE